MRSLFAIILFHLCLLPLQAQKKPTAEIERMITKGEIEGPLTFLSADEMKGRDTGSPELDIAANYIASRFREFGLKTLEGAPQYLQPVELLKSGALADGSLTLIQDKLGYKDDFVVLNGNPLEWSGEIVYIGYGAPEEVPADIRGKLVVSLAGSKDSKNVQEIFMASTQKYDRISAAGAAALVEYFVTAPFPWPALVNYFSGATRFEVKKGESTIPHLWMKDKDVASMKELKSGKSVSGTLTIKGEKPKLIPAKNVAGWVEGTDPKLKNEFLVVSAHYDHVGVGAKKGQDSIYNGARDNALGTVAMMSAARYFAKYPAKRSILFIALTGEEKGLLGSAWYADHPLVPLKQTVFNMDCDGAGYNDKTVVTIIGLEKTDVHPQMDKACGAFGLKAALDPVPEQSLYERSDNYNFARKGVPAIDFAPGIKAFDAELMQYYHQPADEVSSLDFDYLLKFYRSFIYANFLISNQVNPPFWKVGDKYEPAGKALYGKP